MSNALKVEDLVNKQVIVKLDDGRVFKGLVLKRPETFAKGFITLKLKSGYNLGVNISKIVDVQIVSEGLTRSENVSEKFIQEEKSLGGKSFNTGQSVEKPLIVIIHTGGTIASKVDYSTGGVVPDTSEEYLTSMVPELLSIANVKTVSLFNVLSECMNFEYYNRLINKIFELKNLADAFIVCHGTDTLHYTSAALSFALQGLDKPVTLVGSQRSSDRPSSDAWVNLLGSALFSVYALKHGVSGVFACMHLSLNDDKVAVFKGVNLRKMHSSRRDAFKQINSQPLAVVDVANNKVEVIDHEYFEFLKSKPLPKGFKPKLFNPKLKIGFLKAHPNMSVQELFAFKNFDAVIIEGTGLGHLPVCDEEILNAVRELSENTVLVMTSQCISGRLNLNVYATGRLLKPFVHGHLLDMTPETAFIKTAWILSNYDKKEFARFYNKNLVGEVNSRSLQPGFETFYSQ
ncbi:Glu-tRNA(Gln) amidotransferase subunit GatD [Candidatus Woesearchaeota archaeon]|nr:Glu-tRNA(Gln) amidotransferase subunit GatD [Candidatus Woesearchaeota archaeon]